MTSGGRISLWSTRRERAAIITHLSRCAFCQALLAHGQRRQDRVPLEAAEALAWEYAEHEADRMAFVSTARLRSLRA